MSFMHPWILMLALPLPFILFWFQRTPQPGIKRSYLPDGLKKWASKDPSRLFSLLRLITLLLLVVALARPQIPPTDKSEKTEGLDIILTLDISLSMTANDMPYKNRLYSRIEAAKAVIRAFIKDRTEDRIGLVFFSGESYTQTPLTLDQSVLLEAIERLEMGRVKQGTAIGDGLVTAINRVKDVESPSKIIILLTDGESNAGTNPLNAAAAAKDKNVRIYAIGVGEAKDSALKEIAELTGGRYYRANDVEGLAGIYNEIDSLEKTKLEVFSKGYFKDLFWSFVLTAGCVLLLELILKGTMLRRIP